MEELQLSGGGRENQIPRAIQAKPSESIRTWSDSRQ